MWAEILVYILSAFLAIFLLLSIILVIQLLRVAKQIKSITDSTERTVKKVETTASNISAATSPFVIGKVAAAFFKGFKDK